MRAFFYSVSPPIANADELAALLCGEDVQLTLEDLRLLKKRSQPYQARARRHFRALIRQQQRHPQASPIQALVETTSSFKSASSGRWAGMCTVADPRELLKVEAIRPVGGERRGGILTNDTPATRRPPSPLFSSQDAFLTQAGVKLPIHRLRLTHAIAQIPAA